MKNFFLLCCVFSLALCCNAQDTLISDKGAITFANIVAQDADFITISSIDSSNKELVLVPKSSLIFIKYTSGLTEQFYVNDTIINSEGRAFPVKVLEVDDNSITYFYYAGKVTEPVISSMSALLLVKLHDGTKVALTKTTEKPKGTKEEGTSFEYDMGISDAKNYYKTKPEVIAGCVILGATSFFVAPILFATIIAWTPPKNLHCLANPNDALLEANAQYYKGFREGARRKKTSVATASYFSGLGALVVFIGAAVSFFW
jgi:hypothetical protein